MVEPDFLDRANVTVIKGALTDIDYDRKILKMKGHKAPIEFDKLLVAWGAGKKRLAKEYSNVHYLEDRYTHARAHNEILKAKSILVLGSTFEAYQTAASIREFLDSVGYT